MSDYLNNAKESIGNASESIKQNLPDPNAVANNISESVNSFKETTNSVTSEFSSKSVMDASQEFLNSNSLIARFVFVLLVLIVFMFVLNIGIALVTYLATPSKSPYIIHGTLSGSSYAVFEQDPASGNGIVYRSNNQTGGIEFTWSVWLKVDTIPKDPNRYHTVFIKGDDSYQPNGLSKINNGPGVYLYKNPLKPDNKDSSVSELNLKYIMDVVSTNSTGQSESIETDVSNLPIGKWFHVAIRMQNKTLDCYVNGVISSRTSFGDNIPKQNYDSIIYAGNDGFAGSISNLRYYDYALSVFEINSVVYYGPNLSAANGTSNTYFDYLGQSWYKGK
jgi:hypothetical protein